MASGASRRGDPDGSHRSPSGLTGESAMIPAPVRFFNPNGPDRHAVVSVEPTLDRAADLYMIRVARTWSLDYLGKVATTGPYPEADLPERFAEVGAELRAEGFLPP